MTLAEFIAAAEAALKVADDVFQLSASQKAAALDAIGRLKVHQAEIDAAPLPDPGVQP
jgi:hypothetical protein